MCLLSSSSKQNIATKLSYAVKSLNVTECGVGTENEGKMNQKT